MIFLLNKIRLLICGSIFVIVVHDLLGLNAKRFRDVNVSVGAQFVNICMSRPRASSGFVASSASHR